MASGLGVSQDLHCLRTLPTSMSLKHHLGKIKGAGFPVLKTLGFNDIEVRPEPTTTASNPHGLGLSTKTTPLECSVNPVELGWMRV